jgi:putative ABC transport system substrate-binding protein
MSRIFKNSPDKILSFSLVIIVVLTCALLAIPGCKKAEEKKYTVGIVNPNPGDKLITQGFMNSMSKYGYIAGKNLTYIISGNKEPMDSDIISMAAKDVDLIFTVTTPAARAAQKVCEGTKIPVVFVMYDPIESGVVKSLRDHGGNITGIKIRGSTPKALERLLQIDPNIKHIYIPVAFDTKAAEQSIKDVKDFISGKDLKLTIAEVTTDEELRASLSSIPGEVDAIFVPHSIIVLANMKAVIDSAVKLKLPVVSSGHAQYKEGVVISYGENQLRTGEQAGRLAHTILSGTPPSDLPIEIADFFLGINLKIARAIGLNIPSDILQQADYIER